MDKQNTGAVLHGRAKPLGKYPHLKRAGDFVFISGTSARLPDGSIAGVDVQAGEAVCSAAEQTRVVIENLRQTLASVNASLADCVEIVAFLVDMKDFDEYNRVYGEFFDVTGPTRTTIAVRALPHPHMVVEMKAVAYVPEARR